MIVQADATYIPLADDSVDMVMCSPPYCDARTYGIGAQRNCAEWVAWMLNVVRECVRVCKGAAIVVCGGVTRDRNYWPACEGLAWEWWKSGGSMYRPCYWHRVGIPGSGGDQWFRADIEYALCFKRPGPLPWSDNTACGHVPKWAPGGKMAHRLADGARVNQWGDKCQSPGGGGAKSADGALGKRSRPSHVFTTAKGVRKRVNRVQRNGDGERAIRGDEVQEYFPPAIANPGNLVKVIVGGGAMGNKIAHENEAPYPEKLCEHFILSLCPPGGIVLDPFGGSGTTASVAKRFHRRAISMDIRQSQCELMQRRLAETQLELIT